MYCSRWRSEDVFLMGLVQAGCSKRRILICRGSEIQETCAAQRVLLARRPGALLFGNARTGSGKPRV